MENKVDNDTSTEALEDSPIFTKFRIIKNVTLLSFAFLLICTSVDGLQMLQSTLNRDEGIGVVSIAIQFAFGCIIALFFMKYFILKFGTKMTLTFCMLAHIPSTAANFYPHWLTMIPSYAIVGIAATLLWGSNSAYLNDISNKYVNNVKTTKDKSSYPNINDLNCKCPSSDNVKNLKSLIGGQETDCSECSTKNEETVFSCDKCGRDKFEAEKVVKMKALNNENASVLNKTINMLTVFELVNATIETIGGTEKLDSASSRTNPTDKPEIASSTTDSVDKLVNASSVMNTTDKLNSSSHTMNTVDKLDSVFSENNRIIQANSAPTAHHEFIQGAFVSLLVESTTARFFGIHSMFYQSGHIWSNIVSFYVLQRGVVNDTYLHDSSCMCGADFCNIESKCFESNLKEPSKEVKYLLISIFLALNVLAVLLTAIFLDPLENRKATVHYSLDFALATFNQLKRPLQLLIAPLSIYMGMSQGFFYADYPKAFVGCAWGIHHVALVTIVFGITCSVASTLSGGLVKHLGRRTIFITAAVINVAVNIIMLLWTPDSDQPIMFFVVAGMWGAIMGSFWSQLKAFHGILFQNNEEAAFGCYELSHSIGACISFASSNYICLYVKIYMLLFVSSVGIFGYLVAEQIRPRNK